MQQTKDIINVAEDMARKGAAQVTAFFDDANPESEKKAKFALTALRGYASIRSTRAREASTLLGIAKFSKMDGAQLTPVFEMLSGKPMLAAPTEAAQK